MRDDDIKFGIKKSLIYSTIVVLLFFLSLESLQRIRYACRHRSGYWLLFGFVDRPSNLEDMIAKNVMKKQLGVEIIEGPTKRYNGYKKYNPKCAQIGVKINSFGFRGAEFNRKKKDGEYRIVTLGGSTTFGTGTADGFTYPEFLERKLNSQLAEKRYEVINAGVAGSTAANISNLLREEILSIDPDMIILYSLINNFYYNDNAYRYHANLLQTIHRGLLLHSLFYLTLREKMTVIFGQETGNLYKAPLKDILNNFLQDDSFWHELKATFNDIIRTAEDNNIKVVIIKQAVWLRDHGQARCGILLDKKVKPIYDRAYGLLDEVASSENIELIDAASHFNNVAEKDKFFTDGVHLTDKGNEYLAALIADTITFDQ